MTTLHKLILPLIVCSAALLTACHHHDNRRSVPQPIHHSYHSKPTPKTHHYNNLNDYNRDTIPPYDNMW